MPLEHPDMVKKLLMGLLVFATGFGTPALSGEAEKYHGIEVRGTNPIPGYKSWGSGCIETELGGDTCDFSLDEGDLNVGASRKIRVLFLQSKTGEKEWTPTEHVVWRIEDSLSIDESLNGAFEVMDCGLRAVPRIKVVALRVYRKVKGKERPVARIEKTWRVDGAKRKFVEIPYKNVVCGLFDTSGI